MDGIPCVVILMDKGEPTVEIVRKSYPTVNPNAFFDSSISEAVLSNRTQGVTLCGFVPEVFLCALNDITIRMNWHLSDAHIGIFLVRT